MNRTKKLLLVAGTTALGLMVPVVTVLAVPSVQDWLFEHIVEQHLRVGDDRFYKDDSLKVLLCGTSAPVADPQRAQSCVAVFAGGKYYLIDTGPGSGRNLQLWQLQGKRLEAVFLTHFHSDHIGDLGEVNTNAWLSGHPGRLQVFGGPGVGEVVEGFNEAYSQDQMYRTANSGNQLLPSSAEPMQALSIPLIGAPTPQKDRLSEPMHFGDLVVTAIAVNHDPAEPAYGYRFDYHGRSVVISGDTNYHAPLALAAEGADVLVHEAQSQHMVQLIRNAAASAGDTRVSRIMGDIQHYHADPKDAALIANHAHVRLLVFTHLNPPVSNPISHRMFFRGMSSIRGNGWISGEDGTLLTLPMGSTDIWRSSLSR